jgi:transposase
MDAHHGEHGEEEAAPRSSTLEFKAGIVELCRRGDRTIGRVARDFDLTETAVRLWADQAQVDDGEKDGLTSAERDGPARLRWDRCRGRHCFTFSATVCGPSSRRASATDGAPSSFCPRRSA